MSISYTTFAVLAATLSGCVTELEEEEEAPAEVAAKCNGDCPGPVDPPEDPPPPQPQPPPPPPPQPKPDLVSGYVTRINLDSFYRNTTIYLGFKVCNRGTAAQTEPFRVAGALAYNGTTVWTFSQSLGIALQPNDCYSEQVGSFGIAPGQWAFGAVFDVDQQVAESNENNNGYQWWFTGY